MRAPSPPKPRLSVLFARKARTALILRHGPSNVVELVSWDTTTDTFVRGQWTRLVDLSHDRFEPMEAPDWARRWKG